MNFRSFIDNLIARLDILVTQIDGWVAGRKSSELMMITALIPAVLIFGAYRLVIPGAQSDRQEAKRELSRVHQELETYRLSGGEADLEAMRLQIEDLQRKIEQRQLAEAYLQSRLSELEHLYFTRLEWADQLEWIAAQAQKNGVIIKLMENRVEENGAGFLPVMRVDLEGEGGFERVMRYIHALEAGAKISPVERLTLETAGGSKLSFKMQTVLWGLK